MTPERISIFNYEAFYLDYLEGNLGKEDTALLLAFLEAHPELVMEEDDFIVLDPKAETPIFDDKDSLKIVSDDAAITLSNAEHFLIAESEGQLSVSKQEELNALIAEHPQLQKERAYTAAMYLKADQSIVYTEKSELKRKGAVIFWPYIALAAASVLIAFFVVMNSGGETELVADDTDKDAKELPKERMQVESPEVIQHAKDESILDEVVETPRAIKKPSEQTAPQRFNTRATERPAMASVDNIKHRSARRVLNTMDNYNLQPVVSHIDQPTISYVDENDYAQASQTDMKNPIKPITTRLEKSINKPVEFQTGKAADNAGAGFFLKIGNFEVSRKKGKK